MSRQISIKQCGRLRYNFVTFGITQKNDNLETNLPNPQHARYDSAYKVRVIKVELLTDCVTEFLNIFKVATMV